MHLQKRLYSLDRVEEAEVSEYFGVWGPAVAGAGLVSGPLPRYLSDIYVGRQRDAAQAGGEPRKTLDDGGLGVSVRREQSVAPGEQKAILPIPPTAMLTPLFQHLSGPGGYAPRLPFPPAVLVDRRDERDADPGGAQKRRQEEEGAFKVVGTGGVLDMDYIRPLVFSPYNRPDER